MLIRDAVKEDFSRITEIYSDIVLHSTAIFRETPITVEDALSLWKSRLEARSPTIVALRENRIVGYASFGTFRSSPGYFYTVEHTVHVEAAARGTGVRSGLVRELITRAQALGNTSWSEQWTLRTSALCSFTSDLVSNVWLASNR